MPVSERDERRWLLKRQTSGLNVVMGPGDDFNGVTPGEQVWVVPEQQLRGAVEALREIVAYDVTADDDGYLDALALQDRAREALDRLGGR